MILTVEASEGINPKGKPIPTGKGQGCPGERRAAKGWAKGRISSPDG
jgi:hypothetical protein